eukprot:3037609-Prymnesium_polylepis.1
MAHSHARLPALSRARARTAVRAPALHRSPWRSLWRSLRPLDARREAVAERLRVGLVFERARRRRRRRCRWLPHRRRRHGRLERVDAEGGRRLSGEDQ